MESRSGKISAILQDTTITLLAEIIVLLAFFIFYRILNDQYGSDDLGLYALSRRVIAVLIPLLLLGLYDGMGRYIAMAESKGERSLIILLGLISFSSTSVIAAGLILPNKQFASKILFGSVNYVELISPFLVLLLGLAFHAMAHAAFRGSLMIKTLNLLQILNLGITPIVLVKFYNHGFPSLLYMIGMLHGVFAAVPLFILLISGIRKIQWSQYKEIGQNLYVYSVPRIPISLIIAGMAALGPILAAGQLSMTEVGYLALSFTLLIGVSSFISPLGLVLLPHLSKMVAKNQIDRIGDKLYMLVGAAVQIFLFMVVQFQVFSEYLITLWMGESFIPSVPVVSIVFVSVIFYGFFVATRSVLDAISTRPVNTINTAISFTILFLTMCLIRLLPDEDNIAELYAMAFTFSTLVLSLLTYRSLRTLLPDQYGHDKKHLIWGLLFSLALGVVAKGFDSVVSMNWAIFMLTEALLFTVYLWLLHKSGFAWVSIVRQHIHLKA